MLYVLMNENNIKGVCNCSEDLVPENYVPANFTNSSVLLNCDLQRNNYRVEGETIHVEAMDVPTKVTLTSIQSHLLKGLELDSSTNQLVNVNSDDSLLLMELLMSVDEKLTQVLQPKRA